MKNFIVVAVLAFTVPVMAAKTSVDADGTIYHVYLPGPDSSCEVKTVGDSFVREAKCVSGEYFVSATTDEGCSYSFGPAYCGSIDPGPTPPVANELLCDDGDRYILQAGPGVVRCEQKGNRKWCESLSGKDSAEASCEGGCAAAKGAGGCCTPGDADCPKIQGIVPGS